MHFAFIRSFGSVVRWFCSASVSIGRKAAEFGFDAAATTAVAAAVASCSFAPAKICVYLQLISTHQEI